MNGATQYRVSGVPGLYLVRTETADGEPAVFAYLRVDGKMYAGAGDSVLAAVSDVFESVRPGQPVPSTVLLALPTLDHVAPLGERQ